MRVQTPNYTPFFKDWAKPGPLVAFSCAEDCADPEESNGTQPNPTLESDETLDALCGHFRIFQLKNGHRFSTDDVLTAWYGTSWCPSARNILDLGSGIGSVGMIAGWRLQGIPVVTVEAQEKSVELAKKSAQFNGISHRFDIRCGDFRDPQCLGPEERFDLILGSPPYFPLQSGLHGDHPQKVACRFEVRGSIADYCQVASKHLALGGWFSCIFPISPPNQAKRVELAAQAAGLTIVRMRPVVFKEGETPLLAVFGMVCSEHLPLKFRTMTWQEDPLIIRTKTGEPHHEYAIVKLAVGLPPT
jgi:tRNA1(Val) A37 N6-methylase TrmN6